MDNHVSIRRSTFTALIILLAISLMSIAFLLGRESNKVEAKQESVTLVSLQDRDIAQENRRQDSLRVQNPPPPRPTVLKVKAPVFEPRRSTATHRSAPAPRPVAAAPDRPLPSAKKVRAVPVSQPAPRPVAKPDRAEPTLTRAQPTVPTKPKKPNRQGSKAIQTYFQRLDSSLAGTQTLNDPNAFATELLESSLSGDNSKLDQLVAEVRRSLARVQSIEPPPSCSEHHRLVVKQLRQGVSLLVQVGGTATSLDMSSLTQISASGKTMQDGARRLKELENELRSRI